MHKHRIRALLFAATSLTASLASAQEIFRDDFNGATLDTTKWQVNTHLIGRTQLGATPAVSGGFARLKHDTYNPTAPGNRFRGTELQSKTTISRGTTGIEMESRVRVNPMANGLVTSFFTYNYRTQSGTGFWDEMDFEFLSSRMNSVAAPADPVLISTYNDFNQATQPYGDEVSQSSRDVVINPLDLSQFNTFKMRWLPNRLEWYANGRLLRTVTGSLVPTDPTTLRFNFWAPGSEWPAAYSAALVPTAIPANNVSANYDLDWTVVRTVRPAVTATSSDRVFTDRFNNGNVATSDSIGGFWTTRNQGNSTATETASTNLLLTAAGAGYPHAQLASAVRSEFNFFESPIEIEATGIDISSSSSSFNKAYLRFVLSSLTLSSNTQSEFTSDDAFSLRIGADNSVALGFKVNSPNANSEFDRTNLLNQTVTGPVRRFNLVVHPTFYTLTLEHDLSLTDSTPVTTTFNGSLSLSLADWATINPPTGDSAMYIQSQLSNAVATETATALVESMAVNAIRPTWTGTPGGDWNTPGNWSRSMVPSYNGANAILGAGAAPRTANINSAVILGKLSLDNPFGYTINGSGSITVQSPAATARIDSITGNHVINVPLTLASNTQFNVPTGWSLSTAGVTSSDTSTLTKVGNGSLTVANLRGGSLNVASGIFRIAASPANNSPLGASSVKSLTLAGTPAVPTTVFDLANNVLVIDYANATPSPIGTIRQLLLAGRTTGQGLVSSGGLATARLGYIEAADRVPGGGTFAGQAVDGSALIIAYALAGDADLSNTVNLVDFSLLAANFGQTTPWAGGDFDYDGVVGLADFSLLAANFDQTLPSASARQVVPEPTTLSVGLLASALLSRRNPRNRAASTAAVS